MIDPDDVTLLIVGIVCIFLVSLGMSLLFANILS